MTKGFKLHDDLKLGVATAATQIEGDEQNTNWYEFSLGKGTLLCKGTCVLFLTTSGNGRLSLTRNEIHG